MTWQWTPSSRIAVEALHGRGAGAVEIIENFHGLLHGFTLVGFGHGNEIVEKLP
jgi:hypothetical protein